MDLNYIIVEGVIGTGKTSLTRKLQEHYKARLVLETFEENPFLPNFYKEPARWAFQTQMFFLINRFKQQEDLFATDLFSGVTVSDYLFEKDKIFASLTLKDQEFELYQTIFPVFNRLVQQPDCLIYLHSSVSRLMKNIRRRDRVMEREISEEYISSLSEAYREFFHLYSGSTLITVNMDDFDFVENQQDFETINNALGKVERKQKYILSREGLQKL